MTEDVQRASIGKIVANWGIEPLGEVSDFVGGNSFPKEHQSGSEGEIPVIKVSDMNDNYREMEVVENWVDRDVLDEMSHRTATEGSIILPKTGKAVLTNKRRLLTRESSFDNNILAVEPDGINREFLFHVLRNIDMNRFAQNGAVPSITQGMMEVFDIPVPPVGEQERIASVLYTVDQHVNALSQRHDYLTDLKHGLMQDLLTGQKRPSTELPIVPEVERARAYNSEEVEIPVTEVSEAKSSESTEGFNFFGRLQRGDITVDDDWRIEKIKDIMAFEYGDGLTDDERKGGKVPVYGSNGIVGWHNEAYVDSNGIVIARKGSIGSVSYSPSEFYPIDTTYYTSPEDTDENILWLYYLIELIDLNRVNASTAIPSLNRDDAGNLKSPVPPLWEQERIASVLYTVDEMIARTSELREEYEQLKTGLMQDLLSGDVRTPETLEVLSEVVQSADG